LGSIPGDAAPENAFRTPWALRAGDGKIHPWMLPPPNGNDLSGEPPGTELGTSDWSVLQALMMQPPTDAPRIYTSAPAPESALLDSTRIGDAFAPDNFALSSTVNRDGAGQLMDREVHLSWTYLNGLGAVPERDDVRFNVAVQEVTVAAGAQPPPPTDYPSLDEVKGIGASELAPGIFTDGRNVIFRDLSFAGHRRWTDPPPTTVPRQYRLVFPAASGKRYLIRVSAKRYTFDGAVEAFSDKDHVFFIDVQ
jgi:hypothetical protein